MDALSQVLAAVRIRGAVFFELECRSPWGFRVPPPEVSAHFLPPGPERIVQFHWVTEGEAAVALADGGRLDATAGDVVVLPRGDAHQVSHGAPAHLLDAAAGPRLHADGRLRPLRIGAVDRPDGPGGPGASNRPVTRIVCGYLRCDAQADALFLRGLPPLFKVALSDDAAAAWLQGAVRQLGGADGPVGPGAAALSARVAETLAVATLRRHAQTLHDGSGVWLAGASDRVVGPALSLLHGNPGHAWTLDELAARTGSSRSVLGQRFVRLIGEAPMRYLRRWRMQCAARLLEDTAQPIARIAETVGYASEAAFHRAFDRSLGQAPAAYRRQRRAAKVSSE